ncbi:MAG: hypothetical protein AABY22_23180 [Nanoarchaeota archaeon]
MFKNPLTTQYAEAVEELNEIVKEITAKENNRNQNKNKHFEMFNQPKKTNGKN